MIPAEPNIDTAKFLNPGGILSFTQSKISCHRSPSCQGIIQMICQTFDFSQNNFHRNIPVHPIDVQCIGGDDLKITMVSGSEYAVKTVGGKDVTASTDVTEPEIFIYDVKYNVGGFDQIEQ